MNIQFFLIIFLISLFPIFSTEIKEQILKVSSGKIEFTSTASKLTFQGVGKEVSGEINRSTGDISIKAILNSFRTGIKMRDQHMKENYLETHKFPEATYTGKIVSYDAKTGEAEAKGILKVHGVEKKDVVLKGKVTKSDSIYKLNSSFNFYLKDHDIEIPKMVILELSNEIKVDIALEMVGEK